MESNPALSIVIPVLNEAENIPELVERLVAVRQKLLVTCEVIFVDDGSTDSTPQLLKEISNRLHFVRSIRLTRSFGHQAAFLAGLDQAQGTAVVTMDGDLQDPPELILQLWAEHLKGFDVVNARRERREENEWAKAFFARAFYRVFNLIAMPDLPSDSGEFRLISEKLVLHLRNIRERHLFLRGMVQWLGFKTSSVAFVRERRSRGSSKFPLPKSFNLAVDGIYAFSSAPLRLGIYMAIVLAALGASGAIWVVASFEQALSPVQFLVIFLSCQAFFSALVLICVGLMGEYVSRIAADLRQRPAYVLDNSAAS